MTKRHNKKRNIAFVYEALILELTKASLKEDTSLKNRVVSLLKEFFSKGTILSKELKAYKTLLETVCKDYNIALRLYENVQKDYDKLPRDEVFKEHKFV